MPLFADTNLVAVRYSTETNWGETPATPAVQALRLTGESLAYDKTSLVSEEIRSDRQIPSIILAGAQASGNINFELSAGGSYNSLIQSVLASATPTVINLTGLTLTISSTGKTITQGSGSFITDGIVVGQWIRMGGFVNATNNSVYRVNTVTATVLTVDDPEGNLVTEVGPATSETITGNMYRNGVTKRSHFVEKYFSDIVQYLSFTGMRVNTMSLKATARQRITGSFSFIGKLATSQGTTLGGSVSAATTTDIFTASASVGKIREYLETGSPTPAAMPAVVKEVTLNVKNNLRPQEVVGSLYLAGVGYGRFEVDGTLHVYFAQGDATLAQMIADEYVFFSFVCQDAAGNAAIFTLPNIKLTKGSPFAPAINQDVMVTYDFKAALDPLTDCTLQIDLL